MGNEVFACGGGERSKEDEDSEKIHDYDDVEKKKEEQKWVRVRLPG